MDPKQPFFVLVPGASHTPAHYGYLCHLVMLAGFPVSTGTLPSVGTSGKVTAEIDCKYVRDNMIIPVLDAEERDVILLMHSYSGVPGSGAAKGLSKTERAAQGKKTGVIGQIFLACILMKGGDGSDVVAAGGGHYPPHIRADTDANLLRCDDRISPLYHDVPPPLQQVAGVGAIAQCITSFTSPAPRASWDDEAYKGRVAFIRTVKDAGIPLPVQQMMIDGTGVQWIIKDIESSHSPQLSHPEDLTKILVDLAKQFMALE